MKSDYSDKEFAMIKAVSPHWSNLIEQDIDGGLSPPHTLDIIAIGCFVADTRGSAVDSLRRCVKACHDCDPYRKTPEYDALIQL